MTRIQKIWHRDAYRIGIFFGFDEDLKWRAKQAGALCGPTPGCDDMGRECLSVIKDTTGTTRQCGFDPALNTATLSPETGIDLRFIQALPGRSSIKTTTLYTHLTPKGTARIISPLDRLAGERNAKNNTTQNTEK